MPRPPRCFAPGSTCHVICRGNNGTRIFRDDDDRSAYLALLNDVREKFAIRLYHYVLMRNHVHLVVFDEEGTLSAAMRRLNHSYTYHMKRKYGFVGHLWQGRFRHESIEDDAYLLTCGIYVELNPVRAKLVKDPLDHPWSSFSYYAELVPNELLTPSPAYLALAQNDRERRRIYRLLTTQWMTKK